MSDGMLTFVSWIRRGLATGFTNPDGVPANTTTGILPVSVKFRDITDPGGEGIAEVGLPLIGPGDIVGLDTSVITRVWPRPNDTDAESVAYALIELDQADLPWRYTPATSSDEASTLQDKLRPWFSLVVLETSEGSIAPPTPSQKLPVLTVPDPMNLPSPTELWAWGHTQFDGSEVDAAIAREKIKGDPGLAIARLMSPRLLVSNREYIACLVPTFERGRLAGLGMDPGGADALAEAWDRSAADPVVLPVYYSWSFTTGSIANFEEAARLLKPFVLPATVGRRDMDTQTPGLDLPEASLESLPVEGALMSVAAFNEGEPEWPEPNRGDFIEALKGVVNAPADAPEDPIVAPPLYGQWYAADNKLDEEQPTGSNPAWFHQLNSDPRNRVAAALGTKVIQNEQQALLAAGWDQVEEIKNLNEKLRVLQLGRGILLRLWERHFTTVSDEYFLHLTTKLHARIKCGDQTVCKNIEDSPVFRGFLSSLWQRQSRPLGPLGRLQGRPSLTGFVPDVLSQLNQCKGPIGNPMPPPPHDPGDGAAPGGGPYCELIDVLEELGSDVLLHWALVIFWVYRKLLVSSNGDCWWIAIRQLRRAIILIRIAIDAGDVRRRCRWIEGTFDSTDLLAARPLPTLTTLPSIPGGFSVPPLVTQLPTLGQPGESDTMLAAALRAALVAVLDALQDPPQLTCPDPFDLEGCTLELKTQLVPTLTVGKRITTRILFGGDVVWNPKDELEPILVFPEYEYPMYIPLNEISSDWMLPGIEGVKPDTVSLGVTNQKFVEAYMVGLNHEMTRELLWNEFPTDQRGTYFRQFWSISDHILENGSTIPASQLHDIEAIRLWPKDSDLGDNSPRPPPPGGPPAPPFLVLIVKAQLIKKYPNVIVYAQRINQAGTSLSGEDPTYPIFSAMIGTDTKFYGFELTEADVRADNRWYFVLQEQPGEPKFAEEDTDRDSIHYTENPAAYGTSAGLFAKNRFLRPFRLGIQAAALLPAGGS